MANTDYLSGDTTVLSNVSLNGEARIAASRVSSTATIIGNAIWASSLSLGGSNFPVSISATSFLVVAQVVQGSASTFTVGVSALVKKGDILCISPFGGAGVSSISSGLVYHSHSTQDGQFEFRYSNVSTLVQNQSAQSFNLAIIRL
jgi:hypothetical protein